MLWIKYITGKRLGETVEMEDAAAQSLIDNEIAEKTEAPQTVKALEVELKSLVSDSVKAASREAAVELVSEIRKSLPASSRYMTIPDNAEITLPSSIKRYGSLRNFADNEEGWKKAYRAGQFFMGCFGIKSAKAWCEGKGMKFIEDVDIKTSRENSNASSAFLVPDEFQNDLIDLREKYGIFRKYAKIVPMASDTRSDPRRTGGLTVYVVGESTAPTSSDKTWDRVRLTAKKIGVLTKYTKELSEDAVLNIGDDLSGEIAYAFAAFEDDCGFNGTGASTYAGITGIRTALTNVASNAGIFTSTASTWATITLADHNSVVGLLPQYAFEDGEVAWYCSQAYYGAVMQRLAMAGGGNAVTDIVNGVPQLKFAGFPVRIAQKMPTSYAAGGQLAAIFGNLKRGSRLGDRRSTSIRMSDVALNAFEQDEIAVVGFERFDIVAHDVGSATAAGPIVGLKLS